MAITKTIKCKFCGCSVTGELITDEKVKNSKRISQLVNTIICTSYGDIYGAYRHATGKSEDSIQKAAAKLLGGGYYYFKCTNPDCEQDFIKRVY